MKILIIRWLTLELHNGLPSQGSANIRMDIEVAKHNRNGEPNGDTRSHKENGHVKVTLVVAATGKAGIFSLLVIRKQVRDFR